MLWEARVTCSPQRAIKGSPVESCLRFCTSLSNQHIPICKGLVQTCIKCHAETQLYRTAPASAFMEEQLLLNSVYVKKTLCTWQKKNLLVSHIVFSRTKNATPHRRSPFLFFFSLVLPCGWMHLYFNCTFKGLKDVASFISDILG